MSLIRWDPLREVTRMQRSLNDLFGFDFDRRLPVAFAVDIYETREEIVVQAELPGVNADEVLVEIQGTQLSIRAERVTRAPKDAKPLQQEICAGAFVRSFNLGVPVKADAIRAVYERGILTVRLPKVEAARARQIPVHDGESGGARE